MTGSFMARLTGTWSQLSAAVGLCSIRADLLPKPRSQKLLSPTEGRPHWAPAAQRFES